jgi:NAD(P) transhydrogenase
MKQTYDLIVIGSGPAGEAAAMCAAKSELRVAMVEAASSVGGNCTHLGTIPSKALRHYVRQGIRQRRQSPEAGFAQQRQHLQDLFARMNDVVLEQTQVRTRFYSDNGVDVIRGYGRLTSEKKVAVTLPDGRTRLLQAPNIILATGSRPYRPADIDFDHPRIYDSDTLLSMQHTPRHIAIFGAGVIGCEYASIFCGLGIRVDLINTRNQLLDFLDDEITDALSYHLRDQGATIRHQESFEKVEPSDQGVEIFLKSGKRIKADCLLWSNGRSGNSQDLGLDAIGLKANGRGHLNVDDRYQTDVPGIFAVGDLIGPPSLASASYDQGRFCADGICGRDVSHIEHVPTGIYTIPGISSVGQTEAQLTEQKVPYEVGQAFFKRLARANITGEKVGMLKLLFHRETRALLGIHCFGYQAMEIIHVGQAILRQPAPNNTLDYFVNTTFNYPTMAEAYRVAAINGMNRLAGR